MKKILSAWTMIMILMVFACSAHADATFTTLVTFNRTNGALPQAGLVLGRDGNFYGTTSYGGAFDRGTAFKITPGGKLTTLVSFNGANGSQPSGSLLQAKDGNFYGTSLQGGARGDGTVFRMSSNGIVAALFSFGAYDDNSNENTNGWSPVGGLIEASDGNLYGTTAEYGFGGDGTVFRITPNGKLTTLVAFKAKDSARPLGRLVQSGDGNIYGTTERGGYHGTMGRGGPSGSGTVFRISPSGAFAVVASLSNATGVQPRAGLILAKDGNYYGTASTGGPGGGGTIFRMNAEGRITNLVSFMINNSTNGSCPVGELLEGSDGNLYGTTLNGARGSPNGLGTVFRLLPTGVLTTLASFDFSGVDGGNPTSKLVQDKDGNLYGTTTGGQGNSGTIFRLTIKP